MWMALYGAIGLVELIIKKKETYGKPNINYVSPNQLNNSDDTLRRIISRQFNLLSSSESGYKYCVFMVVSEVKVEKLKEEIVLHSQVLTAAKRGDDINY